MNERAPTIAVDPPRLRHDLREQELGEELLVYDPTRSQIHVLNGTARAIYRMCDGQHDLESMERSLRAQFQVPDTREIREDLLEALALFGEKQLLL